MTPSLTCPNCSSSISTAGHPPGSFVKCPCGNVEKVPKPGMNRRLRSSLIALGTLGLLGCGAWAVIPKVLKVLQDREQEQRLKQQVAQREALQAECLTNLKGFFAAEMKLEKGFDPLISQTNFTPLRGNRYAYFVGPGPMEDRSGPRATGSEQAQAIGVDTHRWPALRPITREDLPFDVASAIGLSKECCNITIVCAGNIDDDPGLDVWSVSSKDRRDRQGRASHAGWPLHEVDDGAN
jgi:type IV pilus assembly protein PilA